MLAAPRDLKKSGRHYCHTRSGSPLRGDPGDHLCIRRVNAQNLLLVMLSVCNDTYRARLETLSSEGTVLERKVVMVVVVVVVVIFVSGWSACTCTIRV